MRRGTSRSAATEAISLAPLRFEKCAVSGREPGRMDRLALT